MYICRPFYCLHEHGDLLHRICHEEAIGGNHEGLNASVGGLMSGSQRASRVFLTVSLFSTVFLWRFLFVCLFVLVGFVYLGFICFFFNHKLVPGDMQWNKSQKRIVHSPAYGSSLHWQKRWKRTSAFCSACSSSFRHWWCMLYFHKFHVRSSQDRDKKYQWQHFSVLSAGGYQSLPLLPCGWLRSDYIQFNHERMRYMHRFLGRVGDMCHGTSRSGNTA